MPTAVLRKRCGSFAEVGQPLRILIVDDHPVNRRVLALLLEGLEAEVQAVDDGERALEACRARDWHIVLMDVQMPGLDGLSATRRILAEAANAGRPAPAIIAVTTCAASDDVGACLRAGMIDHVAKPIDAAQLFGAIALAWAA